MFPTAQGQGLGSLSEGSDSFSPPDPLDLKLVHSSESTSIGSPGFASQNFSVTLLGVEWVLLAVGESRTYS